MLIYLALAVAGLVVLAGGAIFGHDHDGDMHFDHDGDHGHDHGGDGHHGNEPTVSIFSLKVIGSFIMAYGCGGFIAAWAGFAWVGSSLIGLAAGFFLGGFMYFILRVLYAQQSNSIVSTRQAVGLSGVVTVEIDAGGLGSVDIMLADQMRSYLARSAKGTNIPKGSSVKVTAANGSELVVELS